MNTIRVAVMAIIVMLGSQVQVANADEPTCTFTPPGNTTLEMECQGSLVSGRCASDPKSMGQLEYHMPTALKKRGTGLQDEEDEKYEKKVLLNIKMNGTKDAVEKTGLIFEHTGKSGGRSFEGRRCDDIVPQGDSYVCAVNVSSDRFECDGSTGDCGVVTKMTARLYGQGEIAASTLNISFHAGFKVVGSADWKWVDCTTN